MMKSFDPTASWDIITNEKINTTLMVPVMLQFMLLTKTDAHDPSSLRWIMSGAAPVPVSLIETYAEMGSEIHQVYGLTETCGPACLITSADAH
jgi:acyl-CoA synthetase (AMP-forming)/AMP-acid ligase II